jgi:hypothetical protein
MQPPHPLDAGRPQPPASAAPLIHGDAATDVDGCSSDTGNPAAGRHAGAAAKKARVAPPTATQDGAMAAAPSSRQLAPVVAGGSEPALSRSPASPQPLACGPEDVEWLWGQGGESFLCVHWVAVPKALRARCVNRRRRPGQARGGALRAGGGGAVGGGLPGPAGRRRPRRGAARGPLGPPAHAPGRHRGPLALAPHLAPRARRRAVSDRNGGGGRSWE